VGPHRHTRPLRPGERAALTRFVIDRANYQDPSPTLNEVPVLNLERYLATPDLAWDLLTLHEPERWDEFFALAELPRAVGADFTVGGRRYGLFGHDFRILALDELIDLWVERALAQDPTLAPPDREHPLILGEDDFAEAVREALRHLHRPDLLGLNRLARTRLVPAQERGTEAATDRLVTLIDEGVDQLRLHPRDEKLVRAIDRTYLRPAANQEAAAEALSLPFSTYRRHLTDGVARLTEWLWRQELAGGN
jgi:hypothetical protein